MVERADIQDPFFRALFDKIAPEIDNRMVQLAQGGAAAVAGSNKTVAENYAEQVSYLRALNDVLEICRELELDRYGGKPSET